MPRHLLLVRESLLKPRSSLQREYVRMSNLACFYSAPLAVSCGCSHCDPELEAGGAKLTCIHYVHLHSVHLGRDLQELSLRPSPNPPHMNHCCLGNSEHGHGSSHWIQLACGLGISATHTPVLITVLFSKTFLLLVLLFLSLAELQSESLAIVEGFTAEHCLRFWLCSSEPSKEPCSHWAHDDDWYQTPFPLIASK